MGTAGDSPIEGSLLLTQPRLLQHEFSSGKKGRDTAGQRVGVVEQSKSRSPLVANHSRILKRSQLRTPKGNSVAARIVPHPPDKTALAREGSSPAPTSQFQNQEFQEASCKLTGRNR
jgi:hypothetical protein